MTEKTALGVEYGIKYLNRDEYGRFKSPDYDFIWRPGKNVACAAREITRHSGKGFHTLKADANGKYETWNAKYPTIVKQWGTTAMGNYGTRSEFGEIVAAVAPKPSWYTNYRDTMIKAGLKLDRSSDIYGFGFFLAATLIIAGTFILIPFTNFLSLLLIPTWAPLIHIMSVMAAYPEPSPSTRYKYSVEELYPNVKVYRSLKKMLKDERLPQPEPPKELTPDDPGFWPEQKGNESADEKSNSAYDIDNSINAVMSKLNVRKKYGIDPITGEVEII